MKKKFTTPYVEIFTLSDEDILMRSLGADEDFDHTEDDIFGWEG